MFGLAKSLSEATDVECPNCECHHMRGGDSSRLLIIELAAHVFA